MKHQTWGIRWPPSGDIYLCKQTVWTSKWHGRRLARMWRRVWVVLHCILFFARALGEGGQLPPMPPSTRRPWWQYCHKFSPRFWHWNNFENRLIFKLKRTKNCAIMGHPVGLLEIYCWACADRSQDLRLWVNTSIRRIWLFVDHVFVAHSFRRIHVEFLFSLISSGHCMKYLPSDMASITCISENCMDVVTYTDIPVIGSTTSYPVFGEHYWR